MIENIEGINNTIDFIDKSNKNIKISILGNNNNIIIKTNNVENCEFNIYGNNHEIVIDENSTINNLKVYINSSDQIPSLESKLNIGKNTIIKDSQIFLQGDKTILSIDEDTTILGCLFFAIECNSSIIIGKNCMLSWGIEIRTSDWHSIYDIITNKRLNPQKSVNIQDRVWIGSNAIILKGVNIGNDSIVGSHSIVTKSVPSNSIVAGNPAKLIRNNVRWGRENDEHCIN